MGTGLACAVVAAAMLAAAPAGAQSYFPTDPPTPLLDEPFASDLSNWTVVEMPGVWGANWQLTSAGVPSDVDVASSYWGQHLLENRATSAQRTALLANATALGYGNLQMEFEISPGTESTSLGAVFDVDVGDDSGYVFSFSSFPASDPRTDDEPHAYWTLVRRDGSVSQTIGTGPVFLHGSNATMLQGHVYRVRVSAFCSNIRVEAQRVTKVGDSIVYSGGCPDDPTNTPTCWDTVLQWTDPAPLSAGQAGLYSASTDDQAAAARFDNVMISTWPSDCFAGCTDWTGWSEDWATGDLTSRDNIRVQARLRGRAARPLITADDSGAWRIDCEAGLDDTCSGMRLLVDLPDPTTDRDRRTTARRRTQDPRLPRAGGKREAGEGAVKFARRRRDLQLPPGTTTTRCGADYNDAALQPDPHRRLGRHADRGGDDGRLRLVRRACAPATAPGPATASPCAATGTCC